ncbi:MAG TPA: alpha/beta fold hydrolase [Ktedonobacteraceae bacterium]|nr:alpha/beta fold hydrolase [Ktedonobacteraceae bacterium]
MKTTINNFQIAYDDHGAGQPVIFLHAFPLNRHMWDVDIQSLLTEGDTRGRFRLVALDWPGFGESDIINTVSTMEEFADIVARLMDTLGMRQAILCGLSMGGYAAFAFLRKYAQRLAGLILADTRPGADTAEARVNRENVAKIALTEGTEAIANMQLPRLISEYTRRHEPQVEMRLRQMINEATPQGIAAASRGMAQRLDSTPLLASIQVPTLVIVGEQDALTPPDVAQACAQRIPNAQLVVIPHAGHVSNMEQSEAFLQAVRAFLHNWYAP